MKTFYLISLGVLACMVSSCHVRHSPPTGQVAAIVNGREITIRQINAELGDTPPANPQALKIAQQQALREIILRTLLDDAARHDKINKSPDYAVQRQRLDDALLARLYQQRLAAGVPEPTAEETSAFIAANPLLFSQRHIYNIDQLRVQDSASQTLLNGLSPLTTLSQAAAYLSSNKIPFQRAQVQVDSLRLEPPLSDALSKLSSKNILVVPVRDGLTINALTGSTLMPLTGEAAEVYAKGLIHNDSVREAENRQLQGLVQSNRKGVLYNPVFRPPAPATRQDRH